MNEELLISIGLTQNQARTYRALITRKSLKPTTLARLIGESRTNCYALLDKLVNMGLATREEENKKYVYYPASPLALKDIVQRKRSQIDQQLEVLDRKMPQMMNAYQLGGQAPKIRQCKGKKELEKMYTEQMEEPGREICFIRSKADVAYFSLQKMEELRMLAPAYKKRRLGITPVVFNTAITPRKDASSRLKRAWISGDEYTSPVEWVVTGNKVQAILMKDEGYGVTIDNAYIADSFRQIFGLLYKYVKQRPGYSELPKMAKYTK